MHCDLCHCISSWILTVIQMNRDLMLHNELNFWLFCKTELPQLWSMERKWNLVSCVLDHVWPWKRTTKCNVRKQNWSLMNFFFKCTISLKHAYGKSSLDIEFFYAHTGMQTCQKTKKIFYRIMCDLCRSDKVILFTVQ